MAEDAADAADEPVVEVPTVSVLLRKRVKHGGTALESCNGLLCCERDCDDDDDEDDVVESDGAGGPRCKHWTKTYFFHAAMAMAETTSLGTTKQVPKHRMAQFQ